jgi:hypothetical protein
VQWPPRCRFVVAVDWPFRGEVSVSADVFVDVEHGWKARNGE